MEKQTEGGEEGQSVIVIRALIILKFVESAEGALGRGRKENYPNGQI